MKKPFKSLNKPKQCLVNKLFIRLIDHIQYISTTKFKTAKNRIEYDRKLKKDDELVKCSILCLYMQRPGEDVYESARGKEKRFCFQN